MDDVIVCDLCHCGPEVCIYCKDTPDWKFICDCGLVDFGQHLISCTVVRAPDDRNS